MRPSRQDFSLVRTSLEYISRDIDISELSLCFPFLILDVFFGLQDDEAEECITDTAYLVKAGKNKGHDRGIDAIYIDEQGSGTPHVHIFNFKYSTTFEKTSNHFPSSEIDKITSFISDVITEDENIKNTINDILFDKVADIWRLFESTNPQFTIHLCSNIYNGLEEREKNRFERELGKYSITPNYILMPDIVRSIASKGKVKVDAKLRLIDKNFFEKSDGDLRALIADVDAKELLRIVCDNEQVRLSVDSDYADVAAASILEDAFEENVRVYLKQKSRINKSIKETALSTELKGSVTNENHFYKQLSVILLM